MPRKGKSKAPPPKERKKGVQQAEQSEIVQRLKARGKAARRVGSVIPALSGLAGSFLGGPAGGAVGLAAGKLISAITGFGDYKISRNSISMGNTVPSFRQGGDGIQVCHREFIRNVVGSTTFSLQTFPINPGMTSTFPWLSLMGSHFEEYEMRGLVFEYRPSSGSAISSSSSALGVVVFATDYDAANPSFANKQQMESYEFSTSTVPFNGCLHPVECARRMNVLDNLYLRTADVSGTDIRLYDMGNFQYATEGMQSAYTVGELWVSYDVTFRKPRIPITSLPSTSGLYANIKESPSLTADPSNFFGTGGGGTVSDTTMTAADFDVQPSYLTIKKAGQYRANAMWNNSTSTSALTITVGTNFAWDTVLTDSTQFANETGAATAGQSTRCFFVTADGTTAANRIGYSVSGTLAGQTNLLLTKVSSLTASTVTTSTAGVRNSSSFDCTECKTCGVVMV
jgi:hypothetical protein